MASLLPIISEILPMILPSSISVTKSRDILPPPPPEDNGIREPSGVRVLSRNAVVNKTDKMCASVLIVKPKSSSTVRHNGEQDAIIYAASGKGVLLSIPKDEDEDEDEVPERHELEQGDFAFIPSWTEHQALNESDGDLLWVVIRSGPEPVEVDLTEWGGPELTKGPPQPR
ncbi:RmlC-like cupin domain-containing protein [Lasiosphaeria hispida]|uniref:RmlC-like cupin domain-containing protein n=1 Tax=Lasiosphaeria hispida TaxID=260671 RepID=A0AAJ0HBN0_9PEZI|nr:RmlC-like cupin domain-containing protein [Lasiosphaeria hispida]